MVATGLGGAQQFGYGAPRRHVIGMKVVLADGSLIKVCGRVVKIVAGYDLCKLFTGSYGTLGVIVEVNFKLRPLPFETSTVVAEGDREALLAAGQRVIDTKLFPVAVELFSPALAKTADWSDGAAHLLLIRFAGSSSAVAAQTTTTGQLLKAMGGVNSDQVITDDGDVWNTVAALPSRFAEDLVWRVGLRPADVAAFLAIYHGTAAAYGHEPVWQAGLGDGRIRFVDRGDNTNNPRHEIDNPSLRINRLNTLSSTAQSLGARVIIEHTPGEVSNRLNTSTPAGAAVGIMQRIKQQLDPDGILPSLSPN